jgi:hypothetical protein
MIIHNPILTGSFTVNGTDVSSITSSAASLTSLNAYTASQNNRNGTYATTGSNTFAGIQTVNSNLVVTGSITAQTLVVQTITSSVDFVTGSTRFGSSLSTSTHQFTGSLLISGSLTSSGSITLGDSGSNSNTAFKVFAYNSASSTYIGISNQGVENGNRTLRMGFGSTNLYADLQGTRLNVADDVDIALQSGGGNVSVGTGSIAGSANGGTNFLVGGSGPAITIRDNSSGGHWSLMARTGGSTPLFRIWDVVNSADRLVINSSGSIGIGTPSPSTLVHINTTRSSGANVDVITLSDNVTGTQTGGFGVRILATSNNGSAKSAIAFEADGGTNNDTAIAFYTQTSAAALSQRLIIDKNGTVRVNTLGGSTNYKFGVSGSAYVNGTNNKGVFITDGASYASIVGLNSAISAYNSIELRASGVDGQLYLASGGNVGFFTLNPSGSVTTKLVHIDGAGAVLRVGPNYPAANGSTDRDFIEIISDGATNKINGPNEFFQILNPGGGAGSWEIDVITGSGGVKLTNGATSWSAISSDRRKKKNFEPSQGLAEVLQIEPVKYHFEWDDDSIPKRMGFIAQNIQPLIPEMVSPTKEKAPDGSDYLTVTPDYILPVLVKAIQELNTKFEEYKTTHP